MFQNKNCEKRAFVSIQKGLQLLNLAFFLLNNSFMLFSVSSVHSFLLLDITPLCGYVAFCFLIHRLMAIWAIFHLWATTANAAVNTGTLNQVTSKTAAALIIAQL